MPEFPIGFDPITNDWMGNFMSEDEIRFAGLVGLTAFGTIAYGAFFTYGAAAVTPPTLSVPATVTFTSAGVGVGTATFVNSSAVPLTMGQMQSLAAMQAGTLGFSEGAVAAILESWGMTAFSLEGLLALALYIPPPLFNEHFGNFGAYIGNFVPGGGGLTTPPGFPGFPGGGHQYGKICYIMDGVEYCHLEY